MAGRDASAINAASGRAREQWRVMRPREPYRARRARERYRRHPRVTRARTYTRTGTRPQAGTRAGACSGEGRPPAREIRSRPPVEEIQPAPPVEEIRSTAPRSGNQNQNGATPSDIAPSTEVTSDGLSESKGNRVQRRADEACSQKRGAVAVVAVVVCRQDGNTGARHHAAAGESETVNEDCDRGHLTIFPSCR